jgi:hypothetical protein
LHEFFEIASTVEGSLQGLVTLTFSPCLVTVWVLAFQMPWTGP